MFGKNSPFESGQSDVASPASLLVTNAPAIIKKNVAQATRMANRLRPLLIQELLIADCRFVSCQCLSIGNRQSAIGNQFLVLSAQHRKFDRRHHLQRWFGRRSGRACAFTESEVSLGASVCGHRYLHRLLSSLCAAFSPGNDCVSSSRNILDFKCPGVTADCEERVLRHADVSLHPWMLVAFDWNQLFRTRKLLLDRSGAHSLSLVPLLIERWRGVYVVRRLVAVGDA